MLKFLCKLVNLTRSYKRKDKGMFYQSHTLFMLLLLLLVPFYSH